MSMLDPHLYLTVKAVHVVAAIAGYGLMYLYPVAVPFLRKTAPRATEGVHLAMRMLYQRVIQIAMIVALLAGGIMITNAEGELPPNSQQQLWIILPILILLTLMLGSGVAANWEQRAAQLAKVDIDRALSDRVVWSDAYRKMAQRLIAFNVSAAVLVSFAAWMMTTKLPNVST